MQIALMIGNSRLHWALFADAALLATWDTEHLHPDAVEQLSQWIPGEPGKAFFPHLGEPRGLRSPLPLLLASVVPAQTALWQNYPNLSMITLDRLPLQGLYPTLGIDRALALWGAGTKLGWPILVIDAGTALTFTGADVNRCLIGGAILPGLGLQLSSLGQKTAALPTVKLPESLPPRWAADTPGAMQSGVVYATVAAVKDFIENWQQEFPDSQIAMTGGDRTWLLSYLQAAFPQVATTVIDAPHAIFWGMSDTF